MENINRKESRQKQLFSLGMSKSIYGFVFRTVCVTTYDVDHMVDPDWNKYIEFITKSIGELREESSVISDEQKVLIWAREIRRMTGPEVSDPNLVSIVNNAVMHLNHIGESIEVETEALYG